MGLPFSKNQARKLGERLRSTTPPAEADIDLLETMLAAYDEALSSAAVRIKSSLGIEPSPRIKSTITTIEKLRRSNRSHLAEIQDLAGLRIVLSGYDREEQDRIRDELMELFKDGQKPAKAEDRRENPSEGYRAVHVVVYVDGLPVEIQVRTTLQHSWAEFFEKLGDRLGRGIRYGEGPDIEALSRSLDSATNDPLPARDKLSKTVEAILQAAMAVSDTIDLLERLPVETRRSNKGKNLAESLTKVNIIMAEKLDELLLLKPS